MTLETRWWASYLTWSLVLSGVILSLAVWARRRLQQHTLFSQLGIPYIPPNIFYGSNHVLREKGVTAIDVIGRWMTSYGKVFGYYVGWRPYLVVSDLELVKQILIKDFHIFTNRPKLVINAQPVVSTVVGLRDQRWKDVRSILAPTFSMSKMKRMAGIMNRKIDLLMTIVGEKTDRGEAIEFFTTYQGLTLDVISECALAMETNCQRNQGKDEFLVAVREFLQNAVNPAILLALYVPLFAHLMSFVSNKLAVSGRMTAMIIKHLKTVIKLRRADLNNKYVDVLQLMLEAAETRPDGNLEDHTSPEKDRPKHKLLSDDEIIANAWVFLLGGFETTASALTYTTYLLATHPEVQEQVYQELISVTQKTDEKGGLSYETVRELKYLDQVLSESLRLYPPVVTFITRESGEECKLGDLTLPKGMNVLIPIWQLHRDPEQWPEPETFDPERFSSDAKSSECRHPMAYLPFGGGPRNCPGMRFAQLEAKLTIARVVSAYRLEVCEQTPQPLMFKIPTVAINPAQGVYIKAVPRTQQKQ